MAESAGAERAEGRPRHPPAAASDEEREAQRRSALEFSAQALTLAGLVLAPERGELAEPRLARLLLRESFLAAARAVTGNDSLESVSEACAALKSRADLPSGLRGRRGLESSLALEGEAPLGRAELLELEARVEELVRWARAERRPRRGRRWLLAGLISLTAALVILLPRLHRPSNWATYSWRASSAVDGYPQVGTSAKYQNGLLFHTGLESGPWVLIDLQAVRKVRQLVLKNRQDCCAERGLPLIVEVGTKSDSFALVGRKDNLFDEWTLNFDEREARYVRLRAEATTYLQLSDVGIR